MHDLQRLIARAVFLPVRPAGANRLGRGCWVHVDPELRVQPNVAAPEVGPGAPRQALSWWGRHNPQRWETAAEPTERQAWSDRSSRQEARTSAELAQ
eukprot:981183-Alexandrium_andersonii.AAC.1